MRSTWVAATPSPKKAIMIYYDIIVSNSLCKKSKKKGGHWLHLDCCAGPGNPDRQRRIGQAKQLDPQNDSNKL